MQKTTEGLFARDLTEKIKEIFLKIQQAWNEHDLNLLSLLETPAFFEKEASRMQVLEEEGKRQVRKDPVIHTIKYRDNYIKNGYEYIIVELKASIKEYIYATGTNEVVEGIKDYSEEKEYQLVLKRAVVDEKGNKEKRVKCVACNADVILNASGKCEYCGTMHYNEKYDWAVDWIDELIKEPIIKKKEKRIFDKFRKFK